MIAVLVEDSRNHCLSQVGSYLTQVIVDKKLKLSNFATDVSEAFSERFLENIV
jgi:hypothetical protein